MEINYRNTRFDLILFSLRISFRRKFMWILFFVVSLGIVIPAIRDLFEERYKLFIVGAIEVAIFVSVMFFATLIVTILWVLIVHSKDTAIFSRKRIIFSDDEIITETDVSKSNLKWKAIKKVEKSNRCIYLYVSPAQAIIIPRREFDKDSDFNDLFQKIERMSAMQ